MKSPFTGGEVRKVRKPYKVKFRGKTIRGERVVYECVDTGHQFTDADLDTTFVNEVFKKWKREKVFENLRKKNEKDIQKG